MTIPDELLRLLQKEPWITVQPGDTVIMAISADWDMEQIDALGTYLREWAPDIDWKGIHEPGFSGVIHVRRRVSAKRKVDQSKR